MKFVVAVLSILGLFLPDGLAVAAGPECAKTLDTTASRARRTVGLLTAELKGMTTNPYAKNAISVCNGAVSRADQYYGKESAAKSVCIAGSEYVDKQIVHLYKAAVSTCRDEFTTQVQRLPSEEQTEISARVAKKEAAIR